MVSPTQRALAFCKRLGFTAAIVERWNPYAKVRQDLFGFADIVVLSVMNCSIAENGEGPEIGPPLVPAIYAIQVTSGGNHASRKAKILAEPRARKWCLAGGMIEVWSFSKKGARGKKKTWQIRREPINPMEARKEVTP